MITDCKAMFDALNKAESAGLGVTDRRAAIEMLGLRNDLRRSKARLKWVHSHAMIADGLTKASQQAYHVIMNFLRGQRWRLVDDPRFVSARKRAAMGKNIFDDVDPGDIEDLKKDNLAKARTSERIGAPTACDAT